MTTCQQIINAIPQLPSLPETCSKVLSLVNDPKSSAADIVEIVKYDQSITANTLRLCNSAYFGLKRRIESLSEAVVLLGHKSLVEIIMIGSCMHLFRNGHTGYIRKGRLWQHSLCTALFSQIILRQMGLPSDPGLYTAALLHDIGKVALDLYLKEEYQFIIDSSELEKSPFHGIEKRSAGIDHAEVGAELMLAWHLPYTVVEPIRNHHEFNSVSAANQFNTILVSVCDLVCLKEGLGRKFQEPDMEMLEKNLKAAQISERFLDNGIDELWVEFTRIQDLFSFQEPIEKTNLKSQFLNPKQNSSAKLETITHQA